MKNTKIVAIFMFKNEVNNVPYMLESCFKHIDYWIAQDNGSTDGTSEYVKNFFLQKNIPGFVYNVEEGWVNFGWNRNHLLQTCLNHDHGCEWILKMDCDEILEISEQFDWKILEDTTIQSFNVPSILNNNVYYRTWLWNAKLPWKFNDDDCHETIFLDKDNIGENFQRVSLPISFKLIGGLRYGESYTNPSKYVSDALKLEEKLIRENTLLTNFYHFWYIGKSYCDSLDYDFPLGEKQKINYFERCIFYFKEFIDHFHDYEKNKKPKYIDEKSYMTMILIGVSYRKMKDIDNAINYLKLAGDFCPSRNEHLVELAYIFQELEKFDEMLEITSFLISEERKNPFPSCDYVINFSCYWDTGNEVQRLHNIASEGIKKFNKYNIYKNIKINSNSNKRLFVVDNIYQNPDIVRNLALNVEYVAEIDWYKGKRSKEQYLFDGLKEKFQEIIGQKISVWQEHGMNGKFQYCTPEDRLVYHHDAQNWAALIYLTPDAPYETGTSFYAAKNGCRHQYDSGIESAFQGGFYDKSKFTLVDTVGNIYNRLVIFDARMIHSATEYFGTELNNSRLFQIFFFD